MMRGRLVLGGILRRSKKNNYNIFPVTKDKENLSALTPREATTVPWDDINHASMDRPHAGLAQERKRGRKERPLSSHGAHAGL
jgi:hypothetical protein